MKALGYYTLMFAARALRFTATFWVNLGAKLVELAAWINPENVKANEDARARIQAIRERHARSPRE